MLTRDQNELLTRVGPGTPMGELMRRYWVPACLSWEVPEADCPPITIKLLGEELVVFRDTSGKVGVVGARCAHRRAHLFWGRNEENGLRCVYHGWKYDCEGKCVDMPSEPAESNFKDKVRIPAYPTYEIGGLIYAFMGPAEKKPAPPLFNWVLATPENKGLSKIWEQCNWLQALEGGIDTAHGNFLHNGRPPGIKYDDSTPRGRAQNLSTAIRIEVANTDYGYAYAGIRDLGAEGTNYVRVFHWVMPWNQIRHLNGGNVGHMWVPMDDENTMVYNWHSYWEGERAPQGEGGRGQEHDSVDLEGGPSAAWFRDAKLPMGDANGFGRAVDVENNFRSIRNIDNKYKIDRNVQKTQTFTGITGINTQDRAVQESMGPIADRTLERLGTTDRAVINARRNLLQAIKTVQDGGDPPGLTPSYYGIRADEAILSKEADWFAEMESRILHQEALAKTRGLTV